MVAAGVRFWGEVGKKLPVSVYIKIDAALIGDAVAKGVNRPVALDPLLWLKRCRRCDAPSIGEPTAPAVLRRLQGSPSGKPWRDGEGSGRAGRLQPKDARFAGEQCGRRSGAHQPTRRSL